MRKKREWVLSTPISCRYCGYHDVHCGHKNMPFPRQTVLIMSGGQGPDEDIAEGEAMARYAEEKGVGREKIIITIKMTGNMRTQPAVSNSRATRIFIRSSCSANQFAYSDRRKNIVTAEQSSIPSSEMPLHNVLGSCIIIQEKTQIEMLSRIFWNPVEFANKAVCHYYCIFQRCRDCRDSCPSKTDAEYGGDGDHAVSNSRATRIFIRISCSANQFAYSDRRKNIVTAEQSSIPSIETPLHNVLKVIRHEGLRPANFLTMLFSVLLYLYLFYDNLLYTHSLFFCIPRHSLTLGNVLARALSAGSGLWPAVWRRDGLAPSSICLSVSPLLICCPIPRHSLTLGNVLARALSAGHNQYRARIAVQQFNSSFNPGGKQRRDPGADHCFLFCCTSIWPSGLWPAVWRRDGLAPSSICLSVSPNFI